jgi:hypothetical protein
MRQDIVMLQLLLHRDSCGRAVCAPKRRCSLGKVEMAQLHGSFSSALRKAHLKFFAFLFRVFRGIARWTIALSPGKFNAKSIFANV